MELLTDDEDENCDPDELLQEVKSLKRKLKSKENEIECHKETVKNLSQKNKLYCEKIEVANEKHAQEMKICKETTEFKLEEKLKLYSSMQQYIVLQENQMHEIQQEKGEDVLFNVSNSVNMFVKQIDELQERLVKFNDENCHLKALCEEKEQKFSKLQQDMKTKYVPKLDYDLLSKEKDIISKNRLTPLKESKNISNIKYDLLTEQVNSFKQKQKELDGENRSLRKKVRDLETECTRLRFAPPKLHIQEKAYEGVEENLSQVEEENIQLHSQIRDMSFEHKKKEHELESKCQSLENQLSDLRKEQDERQEECRDIITDIREMRSKLDKEKRKNEELQRKIKSNEELHQLSLQQMQSHEKILHDKLEAKYSHRMSTLETKYNAIMNLVESFKNIPKILTQIRNEKCQLDEDLKNFNRRVATSLEGFKQQVLAAVNETNTRSNILAVRYKKEIELRKKLHNELVDLKGNIRVFCRVRPVIKEDGDDDEQAVTFGDDPDNDDALWVQNKSSNKHFQMDRVFQPNASQTEVFEDVEWLVTSCLDGFNVCIFAYGQTGSGKTFTMEGTKENPGINQRALKQLFQCSNEMRDWNFTILVSFVEIYNEMLRDLLSVEPTTKLTIKQGKDGNYVPDLTHVKVNNVRDVNEVFALGRANRSTACTDMNERSSRSHSVLTINVIGENINTGTRVNGKLNLVDLAGSERVSKSGSDGIRMKEAQCINKSLSALGDVIHALKNKSKHVPYRNSKLTYLLHDSLGGDSKTLMVVQVSPVVKNVGETICSLNFAQRVRQVELGTATRKVK
uniref:Kinesin-like protein n=2 Tax=Clytia hemisphaerica TaxID=252671 RepID=A0A7M5TT09_9CNID